MYSFCFPLVKWDAERLIICATDYIIHRSHGSSGGVSIRAIGLISDIRKEKERKRHVWYVRMLMRDARRWICYIICHSNMKLLKWFNPPTSNQYTFCIAVKLCTHSAHLDNSVPHGCMCAFSIKPFFGRILYLLSSYVYFFTYNLWHNVNIMHSYMFATYTLFTFHIHKRCAVCTVHSSNMHVSFSSSQLIFIYS